MNGKTCQFCGSDTQMTPALFTVELEGEQGQGTSAVIEKKSVKNSKFFFFPADSPIQWGNVYRNASVPWRMGIAVTIWVIYLWINAGNHEKTEKSCDQV